MTRTGNATIDEITEKLQRRGKFMAYWVVGDRTMRVFPRSKKTCCFATIEAAQNKLMAVARTYAQETRGLVYAAPRDENDAPVWTIAL